MATFFSILVLGLSYGLVLFLLATGMTLTMGLLRVVNMSHGAIYMFAGYCGVWAYQVTGNWFAALIVGTVVGALLGLLLEKGFLTHLYGSPTKQVLLTIGWINIIQNVTQWIWGGYPASVPVPSFLSGSVDFGTVTIPYFRFFVIGFGVVLAAAIWFIQEKTKIGAIVRAGMDNGEITGTLGINSKLTFTLVFVLGSAIAGMASMIGGVITGLDNSTSWSILLNSIIVLVIGGAGSIPGALIGGILIGLVDAFGKAYFPQLASFLIYIVLIIILIIRPQGLMGRKMDIDAVSDNYAQISWGSNESKLKFPGSMVPENKKKAFSVYKAFPYTITLIALVIIPFITGSYTTGIITKVLIYVVFAASLDIIMGYTGNRSFGHAAFFGMGAYTVGILAKSFSITNFWLVLPIVIVVCAILSAIIGYLTLRLNGTNFLLVTMAFGQLLCVIAQKWYSVTGGTDGLIGIKYPNLGFDIEWDSTSLYFFVLIIVVLCYLLMHRFMRSSFGKSLRGVHGNEGRMRSLGFNTKQLKFTGFVVAGIFAGIAGLLYAYTYRTLVPSIFDLETSALPMLMVIMGGAGTLWGPAIGAAVIILVQNYSGILFPDRWPLILGILYVVCVMFFSNGFAPSLKRFWNWVGYKLFIKDDNNGSGSNKKVSKKEAKS